MKYLKKAFTAKQRLIALQRLTNKKVEISGEKSKRYMMDFMQDIKTSSFFPLVNLKIYIANDNFYLGMAKSLDNHGIGWQYIALAAHQMYYYSQAFHAYFGKEVNFAVEKTNVFDSYALYSSYLFFVFSGFSKARAPLGKLIDYYFFNARSDTCFYPEFLELCLFMHTVYDKNKHPDEVYKEFELGIYGEVIANAGDEAICHDKLVEACDMHLYLCDEKVTIKNKGIHVVGLPTDFLGLYAPEILALQKLLKDFYNLEIQIDHPLMGQPLAKPPVIESLPADEVILKVREVCKKYSFDVPDLKSISFNNPYFCSYF